ncbi:MAG: exodeoxyribonuclease V subunit beta [Desulfobacteraceae bacterium]|nr:exodeoxyribonuclease V subunit beta [Desulfobacteraceae bacterium]
MIRPLDPIRIPLTGRHLIEASAGTGKTYAITGLYLRLLLEEERPISQLLVVTYTEAACQELRDKLRARLLTARRLLLGQGRPGEDPFLAELLHGYQTTGRDQARLSALLVQALLDFDLAPVFTIHGFCQRALQDSAFESGAPFTLELIESDSEMRQQTIDDYWRSRSPAWPPALTAQLLADGLLPDRLPNRLDKALRVMSQNGESALRLPRHRAVADLDPTLIKQLAELWQRQGQNIHHLLLEAKDLSRSEDNYRQDVLERLFVALDLRLTGPDPTAPPLAALGRLSQSALAAGTKRGKQPPSHPFFDLAERLRREVEEARDGILLDLLRHLGPTLAAVKEEAGVASFDDLLTRLRAGLRDQDSGPALAARLFAQYPVAMIDEFQDTDPVQYEIFSTIYRQGGGLFLVGDPKQAIYGFRGADIFSYLKAVDEAEHTHTLEVNWRSEPGLIKACNQLFASHPRPFLLDGIGFSPALSPERHRRRLILTGSDLSPLTVFTFAKQERRDQAKKTIARWLARQVRQLLTRAQEGQAYFETETEGTREPLRPGDVAVLVRNHREGRTIKEALAEYGLAAVTSSRQSVFHAPEAAELSLVLEAAAEPGDERRLRQALATRLLGYDLTALAALAEDLAGWDAIRERFAGLHRLWRARGPATMLNRLLAETGTWPRLAAQKDGERRLTNLRHLLELLQQASDTGAFDPPGLVRWLAERRREDARQTDEASLLRLESDENLLKIVTIHKSKGLQYPVVLAPFLWDSSFLDRTQEPVVICHDHTGVSIADLGSEERAGNRLRQRREALAEDLRLLYVALTRAENRCLVCWCQAASGRRFATASSPLQYLFSGREMAGTDIVAALENDFQDDDQEHNLAGLNRAIAASDGTLAAIEAQEEESETPLAVTAAPILGPALYFTRPLNRNLGLRSFSGLQIKEATGLAGEAPDHDGQGAPYPPPASTLRDEQRDMFSFPRGPEAGSCLHAILEELDFQESDPESVTAWVREKLIEFRLDPGWAVTVREFLFRLTAAPLDQEGKLRLNMISRRQRVVELEFYYPLPPVDDGELKARFAHSGPPLKAAGTRCGFMKGFIDLVFEHQGRYYLADYKSNYLGPGSEDYGQEQMAQAMAQAGYDLQAKIYALALHRYLSRRLADYDPERHWGGVFYLFLRGIDPERGPERGVYFLSPDRLWAGSDRWTKGAVSDLNEG